MYNANADVKYGAGSFQPTRQDAEELAASLVHTGEANGLRPTTAFLTRMDEPIGSAVGNWLEVRECLDVMRGHFTPLNRDLVTLVVVQSAQMLHQAEAEQQGGAAAEQPLETYMHQVLASLQDGSALAKFRQMTVAQGGDPSVIDRPETYPRTAQRTASVCATQDGYIAAMNALTVGQISVLLGAGRKVAEDAVDPTAGILLKAKVGHAIKVGDEIAQLFTSVDDDDGVILATAVERFHSCLEYSSVPVTVPPIISHVVTSENGVQEFVVPDLGL